MATQAQRSGNKIPITKAISDSPHILALSPANLQSAPEFPGLSKIVIVLT